MTPLDNMDSGLDADKPHPGSASKDKMYYSEDTQQLWISDGDNWITAAPSVIGGGGDAVLANDQEFTGKNTFSDTTVVVDSTLEMRQTGVTEALAALDANGQLLLSDGIQVPVSAAIYDSVNNGVLHNYPERFAGATRFENVNHYNPSATIWFDGQTNPAHAAILTSPAAPGDPIYELNVSGGQRWGTQGAGYQAFMEHAFPGGLRITANVLQMFDQGAAFEGILMRPFGATSRVFASVLGIDSTFRYIQDASGRHEWGDGTNPTDASLYRSGAGELRTDASLVVDNAITVKGDVTLGDAITDLIGLYGAAAVAQAAAIAAPTAPGVVYDQAEAQSAVDAINDIRAALAGIGVTA
jgi:hypothetical protein